MSLEELLAGCKSLKRLEGDAVPAFIADRQKKMESAGIHGLSLRSNDQRMIIEKRIPTGFQMKGRDVKGPDLRRMAEEAGVAWDAGFLEPEPRGIWWRMSDERPDRHGDIVRQKFQLENFRKNPVLLDCHRWDQPPIGNVVSLAQETMLDGDYSGPSTLGLLLFATPEMSPTADSLYRLARARLLRAGSIGFYPLIITYVEDPKERERLGLGRWGVIMEMSELAEFSVCAVPANPGAVQNALRRAAPSLRASDAGVVRRMFEDARELYTDQGSFDGVLESIDEAFKKFKSSDDVDVTERLRTLEQSNAELRAELLALSTLVAEGVRNIKDALGTVFENQSKMAEVMAGKTDDDEDDFLEDDDEEDPELEDLEEDDDEDGLDDEDLEGLDDDEDIDLEDSDESDEDDDEE